MHIGGAVHVDLVVVAGALSRLANLQEKLAVSREFHDVVVAGAFAGDPEVPLVIDVETVNLLRPVVAFSGSAPTFDVVPGGIELHDRGCRHATFRLRWIRGSSTHVCAEAASVLRDPDVILRVNGHTTDGPEHEFLRHLRPERIDFQNRHIAALCHHDTDEKSCHNKCSQTGTPQGAHMPSDTAHHTRKGH